MKYKYSVEHYLLIANLWSSRATFGWASLKCYGLNICCEVKSKDAVEFKNEGGQSLFSIISQMGPTNFFESYFVGNFFNILDKHKTAFLRTLIETLLVNATSMMVSAIVLIRTSGTMVPIIENASDCAG